MRLPNFSGEVNWTSSLRSRAGFPNFGRDSGTDFTYHDRDGSLTRHLQQLRYPYPTPEWLSTVYSSNNAPLYRLEVKTTTSEDHKVPFFMSSEQYKLVLFAKRFESMI